MLMAIIACSQQLGIMWLDMSKESPSRHPHYKNLILAFAFSSLVAVGIVLINMAYSHSGYYLFLIYNLSLAFIAPLLALWLVIRLKTTPWLGLPNILITLLWLGFLPNSFYMITDLIHVQSSIGIDLLFNIVLVMLFIFNSVTAGFLSVYLVHKELLKRMYYTNAHIIIAGVFLLCSFAIYLGRFLRWNSWNVITSPFGILFDVTDTVLSPSTHPQVFATTASFFLLLGAMYVVIWQLIQSLKNTD
jgi:uncharacterized membrane protein